MTRTFDDDPQVKAERAVSYLIADVKDVRDLFADPITRQFIIQERADIGLALSRLGAVRKEIIAAIQPSDEAAA